MLKHLSPVLRFGLAAAVAALLPLTEAAADLSWNPADRIPPLMSRECTIVPSGGGSVRVIAGPDTNYPLNTFPVTVPNSNNCPTGTCLRWDYRWIYTGLNPSLALVSVASSVNVIAAPFASAIYPPSTGAPTTFDSSINYGNVAGELGLKYTANAATYDASFYTDLSAGVGVVTAGFKAGNKSGFCAIAGANKTSANPDLSFAKDLVTTTLGCTATWTQSPDGCVTGVTVTGTNGCYAIQSANGSGKVNLQKLHDASKSASCATEINAPGSSNVCRYNTSLRTYTCVSVP